MNLKLTLFSLLLLFASASYAQQCNLQPTTSHFPDTICTRRPLQLLGNSPVSGVSYSWTGPNGFTSTAQNPVINPVTMFHVGNFILSVSKPGCTTEYDTLTVDSILSTPNLYPMYLLNDVCIGDTMIFSLTSNLTAHPCCFHWITPRGTFIKQTPWEDLYIPNTSLNDTGIYKMVFIPNISKCGNCISDTSYVHVTGINITHIPPINATISASPAFFSGFVPVTFTANTLTTGYKYKYQWRKNGMNIPAATDSIYTGTSHVDFVTGDSISVLAQRTDRCITDTVSNPYIISISIGVAQIKEKAIYIYPNPSHGTIILKGKYNNGDALRIAVYNLQAEIVYETNILTTSASEKIVFPQSIASGTYMLKLTSKNESETIPIIIR